MAAKLYPPYIDGKVPAFDGAVLTVPFRHNRAVNYSTQVKTMSCKIKTVSTNEWVWTLTADANNIQKDPDTGQWSVVFDLSKLYEDRDNPKTGNKTPYYEWLIVGVFYKIQIAYVDNSNQVGYFSDVGVTKYTAHPDVTIDGLYPHGTNNALYNYVGVYSQYSGGDLAERAYSYCFTIYDSKGDVFLTSGEQIHNSSLDTEIYESRDEFYVNKELIANRTYKIQYVVTTINGLVASSQSYNIIKKDTIRPSINAVLEATPNYDDGYIELQLIPKDDKFYSGNFAISRSSSIDNFQTWDEICKFTLNRESALRHLFKDFTVEQGIQYCYSLQQYNTKGLYSNRMKSEIVLADFEDMFLYDGKRQLKIRFNPSVSSFKNDILENKIDTIGGKYPFIFRNGNVKYKEFPIGGLISYLQDDQNYFLDKSALGPLEFQGTDLTSENIRAERLFKLEVMEWLNNGQPKLFRSPTEGNYLVRLLNISLSPNAPTGRMLHQFTAQAYEIADTSFNSLTEYNLFVVPDLETTTMRFMTIKLDTVQLPNWVKNNRNTYLTDPPEIRIISQNTTPAMDGVPASCYLGVFEGVAPGSIFGLQFKSTSGQELIEYIKIGETEVYQINTGDNALTAVFPIWTPNISKVLEEDRHFDGMFTFGYYSEMISDNFSNISNFDIEDRMTQFFGLHKNIIKEIEDIRTSVGRVYWMKFLVRDIKNCFFDTVPDEESAEEETEYVKLYYDQSHLSPVRFTDVLPTSVYADMRYTKPRYYSGYDLLNNSQTYLWSGDNTTILIKIDPSIIDNPSYYWTEDTQDYWTENEDVTIPADRLYKFAINGVDQNVDLKTIGRYIVTDIDSISSLSLGRMLMVDIYYQTIYKSYAVEETDAELANLRYLWAQAYETFLSEVVDEDVANNTKGNGPNQGEKYLINLLTNAETGVNDCYAAYIEKLELALNTEQEG